LRQTLHIDDKINKKPESCGSISEETTSKHPLKVADKNIE